MARPRHRNARHIQRLRWRPCLAGWHARTHAAGAHTHGVDRHALGAVPPTRLGSFLCPCQWRRVGALGRICRSGCKPALKVMADACSGVPGVLPLSGNARAKCRPIVCMALPDGHQVLSVTRQPQPSSSLVKRDGTSHRASIAGQGTCGLTTEPVHVCGVGCCAACCVAQRSPAEKLRWCVYVNCSCHAAVQQVCSCMTDRVVD